MIIPKQVCILSPFAAKIGFFFGHIENGKMILNDAGRMVEKWYNELENKYPYKICHKMVVMPNHFHCIIENNPTNVHNGNAHIGATLRGRPAESKYEIYSRSDKIRLSKGKPH